MLLLPSMQLTLAIPTFHRPQRLKSLLTPILEYIHQTPSIDILVINDGDDQETHAYLQQLQHPQLNIIHNSNNLGFRQNFLHLINSVTGKYFALIWDDSKINLSALPSLCQFLQSPIKQEPANNQPAPTIGLISTLYCLANRHIYRGKAQQISIIPPLELRSYVNHAPGLILKRILVNKSSILIHNGSPTNGIGILKLF